MVSPLHHIMYCVCKHQVNPPCHEQDPSQNVLDHSQDFMLHNTVLQVKNQLTNSAQKDFKWKLGTVQFRKEASCEEKLEEAAALFSLEDHRICYFIDSSGANLDQNRTALTGASLVVCPRLPLVFC